MQEVSEKLFYMVPGEILCKVRVAAYDTCEYLIYRMKVLKFVL